MTADRRAIPRSAFVGQPDEASRLGFERASALGFVSPHPKTPDEACMVKRLPGYSSDLTGRIVYPAAFDGLGVGAPASSP